MKLLILPLLLFASIICTSAQNETLHPWTDSQGRTLQASFISLDSEKVTIKWNGQVVPIPLVSLSPESQNLAKQLASKMNSGSTAGSPAKNQLHSWTDVQGRTLQARFVSLFAGTVTIEWNGQMVPLPMNSLSAQSQELANRLASQKFPTSYLAKPNSQTCSIAPKPPAVAQPTVVTEDVALDEEHNWQATNGSLIKAKFISIEGEDINLLMNQGRSEVTVPLARLTKDSQSLAQKLNKDLSERNKMRQQEANKRSKMEVPSLVEADLSRYHQWMSYWNSN